MSVAIEEPPERVIQFKITTKIIAVNRVIVELSVNNMTADKRENKCLLQEEDRAKIDQLRQQ